MLRDDPSDDAEKAAEIAARSAARDALAAQLTAAKESTLPLGRFLAMRKAEVAKAQAALAEVDGKLGKAQAKVKDVLAVVDKLQQQREEVLLGVRRAEAAEAAVAALTPPSVQPDQQAAASPPTNVTERATKQGIVNMLSEALTQKPDDLDRDGLLHLIKDAVALLTLPAETVAPPAAPSHATGAPPQTAPATFTFGTPAGAAQAATGTDGSTVRIPQRIPLKIASVAESAASFEKLNVESGLERKMRRSEELDSRREDS